MTTLLGSILARLYLTGWRFAKVLGPNPIAVAMHPTPMRRLRYALEMFCAVWLTHTHAHFPPRVVSHIAEMRLRQMLAEAQELPYWKNRITLSSILPSGMPDIEFVRKKEIRDIDTNQLSSNEKRARMTWRRTSGTSGEPFVWGLYIPTLLQDVSPSFLASFLRDGRLPPLSSTPWVVALNMPHGAEVPSFSPARIDCTFNPSLGNKEAEREHLLNIIETIEKTSLPRRVLFGYPSELLLFAQAMRAHNLTCHFESITTTGQGLEESVRATLQSVLRAPAYSLYATRELGPIALECSELSNTFHVFTDRMLLEFFDEVNGTYSSSEGSLVVTSLDQGAMPLIRYALDDVAELKTPAEAVCVCGSHAASISFSGRSTDYITLPNGKHIPARRMRNAILSSQLMTKIRRFQTVEHERTTITLRLDTYDEQPLTPDEERVLVHALKKGISEELRISIVYEKLTATGKFKDFVPFTHAQPNTTP